MSANRKSAKPSPFTEKSGAAKSNYAYGLEWERWIANYFRERFGGHYDLSPGSRGAADIINYTPRLIICSQAKASRAGASAHPSVSLDEQARLRARAEGLARLKKIPAVAMSVLIKGHHVRFKRVGLFLPQTTETKTSTNSA